VLGSARAINLVGYAVFAIREVVVLLVTAEDAVLPRP
jgi:hypothetical protein